MSMQGLTKFAYVEAEAYWLGSITFWHLYTIVYFHI